MEADLEKEFQETISSNTVMRWRCKEQSVDQTELNSKCSFIQYGQKANTIPELSMNREVKQACRGYAHTEGGHGKDQRETQTEGLGQSEHTWEHS